MSPHDLNLHSDLFREYLSFLFFYHETVYYERNDTSHLKPVTWQTETETKWPPFSKRHFIIEFSWLKMYQHRLKFHWNLFIGVHLIISRHWFIWWRHHMETFSALLALCGGIHRSPVNSPHKGQWRGALVFSLICVWINGWVNKREAGD